MFTEYNKIKNFYGKTAARRSNVPLINHINEGLIILDSIDASLDVKKAFCLHPMVQSDKDLYNNFKEVSKCDAKVISLAMEYRNIANQSLSDIVVEDNDGYGNYWYSLKRDIVLSPLIEVNQMLIADKVQNKKDFMLYHYDKHERSGELEYYFDNWLEILGVTNEDYIRFLNLIEGHKN